MELEPMQILMEILLGSFTVPLIPLLTYYVIIQMTVFVVLILTSWLLYPRKNHYSIMRCTMSFLGSPDNVHNPQGWYFFSIAVIFKMISDIPLMLYMFHYMSDYTIFGAYLAILLYGITILSGVIVGLFPDTKKNETSRNFFKDLRLGMVHNVAAVLSFGAALLANFTVGLFYLFNPTMRVFSQWFPPLILFLTAVTGGIWSQIKWQLKLRSNKKLKPWPGKGIYSLPMWEWTLFIASEVFIYWNVFII